MNKTWKLIFRTYYFFKMKNKIQQILQKCVECNQNKIFTHVLHEIMQSISAKKKAWNTIAMNFITDLSFNKNHVIEITYDDILMITDKLIKKTVFISCNKTITTKKFNTLFLKQIATYKKISKVIISNKNKLFTFKFWKELTETLNIKRKMFTIFHSQTNKQTKTLNQTLKQYLRMYVNEKQDNWVKLFFTTMIIYNNMTSNATKISSHFANHESHMNISTKTFNTINQNANLVITKIHQLQKDLPKNLKFLIKRIKKRKNTKKKKSRHRQRRQSLFKYQKHELCKK
jgi:hypothetical protein